MWNVCLINFDSNIDIRAMNFAGLNSILIDCMYNVHFCLTFLWQSFDTCDTDLAGKQLCRVWQPAPTTVKKIPAKKKCARKYLKNFAEQIISNSHFYTNLKSVYKKMRPDSTCDKWHPCLMWCFYFKGMVGWSSSKRKSLVLQKMASCLETDCSIFDGEIKKSPWERSDSRISIGCKTKWSKGWKEKKNRQL